MQRGDKAAIVCCSNGLSRRRADGLRRLTGVLADMGLEPVQGNFIYEKEDGAAGTAEERAGELMGFFRDSSVKAIFDISGGDYANEILPYLDFDAIGRSRKQFWGYSDLTVLINAIYAKTGNSSVLYQVRNLISDCGEQQREDFARTIFGNADSLYDFSYDFCQGESLQGIVVGGNVRCLLKLAGTEYFPDTTGKILLLEAFHGSVPQLAAYFSQLQQLGVLHRAAGILLGTFTQMEEEGRQPDVVTLLKRFVSPRLPIARTAQIGHGADSRGIVIGEYLAL